MKKSNKKKVTVEDLAIMVKEGFDGVEKNSRVRFAEVNKRLDRIEKFTLADHRRRIEFLEIEVRRIKELLAFK